MSHCVLYFIRTAGACKCTGGRWRDCTAELGAQELICSLSSSVGVPAAVKGFRIRFSWHSSAWVASSLSFSGALGQLLLSKLQLPASDLLTLLSPIAIPKPVAFSLFPATVPKLSPCLCPGDLFPLWQFACCCPQHRREREAAVLPVSACPARSGSCCLCRGHCLSPRWAVVKGMAA